ncbi:helix-turn-helix domain-containing GNAT family N-acetyltransferase [Dactylosporangium sp. NBC_01737]|uniref:bifunctional helix-turn-helix transcriptional regulator/GNAT family N-acetyltransferase n=1 Tax=Dactylosporangium sp. NBC_01737 TaxID=2975959 RepID=UPI003FA3AB67|nr:helix-turn-helix domain-containing GNAT family N-acetyltransferase [Dactylosporangium sp. NBC_01737]
MTIAAVREFNRYYTNLIGALRAGLLDSAYSLAEVRVLYELAVDRAHDTAELRRLLDIDAGYLSRILGRLEADGLVARSRSAADARRRRIELTPAGREAFAALDARSEEQIAGLLASVGEVDRRRLVGAMDTIRSVFEGVLPARTVVLRSLLPGDLGWVVQRHGALYAAEYGLDATFEAMVARIAADYAASHDPKTEAAWIAEVDGAPVGSIFCVRAGDGVAKLRLLFVEPSTRGMGVGGALVEECVRFARRAGYREMVLYTQDVLTAARRIYQRAGFVLDSATPASVYGVDVVEEEWRLPLV